MRTLSDEPLRFDPTINPLTDKWVTSRCEWTVRSSPEALWPFITDTHRLNYESRNPPIRSVLPSDQRLTNGYRRLRASLVEFEEAPFEWQRPYLYTSRKRFLPSGLQIFAEMQVRTQLIPLPEGGSKVIYQIWARPGNWIGRMLARRIIHSVCSGFEKPIRRYDKLALEGGQDPCALPASIPPRFVSGGQQRLALRQAELERLQGTDVLTKRLADYISTTDAINLAAMRPYALADLWNAERRDVLELCLDATRIGLLKLHWEILCPLCRGSKQRAESLRELETEVHCYTCNIDFSANFARSIEVLFTPNQDIRQSETATYCMGGPQLTPHIVVQQLLQPGDHRQLSLSLETGRYRLRGLELSGSQTITVAADGMQMTHIPTNGWSDEELVVAPSSTLILNNTTDIEQLLILERTEWNDQAATGVEVITLQRFRDLFAAEALRPHQRIAVGSLTVVFTDLRDSTRMYRQLGDAVAFGHIMTHFDILKEAITAEGGAVVKTIGDAVMAVFINPLAALKAVLSAQATLAQPKDNLAPLILKAGLHHGPCISVTLNERLDYFGTTVNLASRLEHLAQQAFGTVVISDAVRSDPEVAAHLDDNHHLFTLTPIEASIKGFEGEQIIIWGLRQ